KSNSTMGVDITANISYILSEFQKEEFNPSDLVKFLYKKKKDYSILKEVFFDNDGIEPDSNQVYESLTVLMPHFIGAGSAGKLRILSKEGCKTMYKFYEPAMNKKEISELETLSKEFQKFSK
ncbi:MAG: hypothetical protein Q8O84_05430, partial [Nanoarchaeota archaeon]|nr:hypothetical protein [Nanoarchaeota archaeon]